MLNTFERKILRRIYGPIQEEGRWHPRWNNELYTLYDDLNIVEDIKIGRLRWAGHIIRMEEERIPEEVLNGTFNNSRPVGRPRTRWADVVQSSVSQTVVRGPQVVLGFCPCGPFRLNIIPKKTEKIKLT